MAYIKKQDFLKTHTIEEWDEYKAPIRARQNADYPRRAETLKSYQKKHTKENGYANQFKSIKKRNATAGCNVSLATISACAKFFGMTQEKFKEYRSNIGYTFHHCFGLERPREGVFLPNDAHDALHHLYGRDNRNVTIDKVEAYCTEHNIHFIVIADTPLLPYHK